MKKRRIVYIVMAVLLLVYYGLGILMQHYISQLPEQLVADRWEFDGKADQVSMFFTEDQLINENSIKRLEYTMESKMAEKGIVPDDEDDDQADSKIIDTVGIGRRNEEPVAQTAEQEKPKIYSSCYCAQGIVTISFERLKAENVDAIGVAGDFFLFHPMELVSGSYFGPDDIMKDLVVLDEDLAWQLFGSNDIVGQCVTIGGINHYVAGVVKRIDGRFPEAAGLTKGTIYMSYDSLAKYGTILSGRTEQVEISEDGTTMQSGGINCYEVVMPSPVDGIVAMLLKESVGLDDKYIRVVDNTERFNGLSLFEVASNFGIRSMWTQPIFYPYWENVARGWEDVLSVFFMIRMVCIVIFWLIVAALVVLWYRNKTWTTRDIVRTIADKKYDYEARLQQKKNGNNGSITQKEDEESN